MPTGEILVTPSDMIIEDMVPEDVLVMDIEGNIIEGERKPSVDTVALLYILKHMPEVNAVIHTHQPYATGVGLVTDELPCNLTTLANATRGAVKVCPYSSAAVNRWVLKQLRIWGTISGHLKTSRCNRCWRQFETGIMCLRLSGRSS